MLLKHILDDNHSHSVPLHTVAWFWSSHDPRILELSAASEAGDENLWQLCGSALQVIGLYNSSK